MLKINLLPPYINQQGKIRTAWTLVTVVLAAELAGLTYFQLSQRGQEDQLLADVQTKETQVTQVEQLAQKAKQERDKIQPIKNKTDFINQLLVYNKVRPNLYEHVASYIYREVWISGMQAEQNVLTMPASAKSISGVGRFLLFMQNNPDFTQVRISQVPGWPSGTAGVEASPLTGGGGPSGPMGGPGYGGPPGGSGGPGMMMGPGGPAGGPGMMMGSGGPPGGPDRPGMMMGSGGPPGGPDRPGMMGSGGPPGFGGPPGGAPPIFGGAAEGGAPGLMNVPTPGEPGSDVLTGGGAPIPYPSAVEQPKLLPVYFGFTVTGILAKPIIRPTFLGAGGGEESAGGPGGYGTGGPGGYGMPGGPGGPGGAGM